MSLTQEEMISKYGAIIAKKGKVFRKSGIVSARPATLGENVVTSIGGEVETRNSAKEGDWVITNPTGENYIVSDDKLQSRYEKIGEGQYKAKGKIRGIVVSSNDAIECPKFVAAWGEDMIMKEGDVLAIPIGSNPEVYRIERLVFEKTYEEDMP